MSTGVAVPGLGNIGTDLIIKGRRRAESLRMVAMAGIDIDLTPGLDLAAGRQP